MLLAVTRYKDDPKIAVTRNFRRILSQSSSVNYTFDRIFDPATMKISPSTKIISIIQLYEVLPEHERLIVDVLRQIIIGHLPANFKEKISYNVPFFYGKKGICIIWPSTIPRGGIKDGVLLGFWYGNKLKDLDNYLTHGSNKQIFYKIFYTVDEINENAIAKLLNEAVIFDRQNLKIRFKARQQVSNSLTIDNSFLG